MTFSRRGLLRLVDALEIHWSTPGKLTNLAPNRYLPRVEGQGEV